ncbi:MAG: hypothetical protein EHM60_07830 [Lysobacterales bacterium]|nr:MAG: hypothetical protein EHM60_07830 [Xanthomonadales bacterium]
MEQSPTRGYRLGDFLLDLPRRRLTRADGETLPLSGRAFDVLAVLVERRDRMVSKRELLETVWPQTVVEENNLTQAISTLRRALGDSRESPRHIVTVAGRGYQYIGEVAPLQDGSGAGAAAVVAAAVPTLPAAASAAEVDAPAVTPAVPVVVTRRRLLIRLAAIAAGVAAGYAWWRTRPAPGLPSSIAVLPFRPLTPEGHDPAIELGVAELLVNRLSALPGVVVRPLSSVRKFAGEAQDPLAAGRELEVEAVVEGNVQMRGGRVRLTARLLDVDTGASLWAGDFTESYDDFFRLQDAVATQLVGALAIDLPDAARRRLRGHATADAEAWQLYANGRYQLSQRTAAGSRAALRYFEAAERRDPTFARAAAGASESWAIMATQGVEPPSVAFRHARAAAERALSLAPGLPDAHVAYGHVLTQYDRNFEGGRAAYRKALEIDPNYAWAHLFLGLNTLQSVNPDEGLDHVRRAQALEPAVLPFNAVAGFTLYMARRFDEARGALQGLLEVAPEAALPRQFLARVLLATDQALAVVKLLEGRNDPGPGSLSNLGRAYAKVGNVAAARAEIAHAESLVPVGHGVGWDLSLLYLELGDRERALEWLERAVDDRSQMLGYMNFEPALDPLRDDPRLRVVARRINLA